ncbi:MAG: hypothetical protein GY906_18195 [bacterium]|nr:hypothetical protein [bacterium]
MEALAFVILVLGLVGAGMWRRHLREAKQLQLRQIIHEERVKAMECELPLPGFDDDELSDSLSLLSRSGPREDGLAASITWVRLVTLCLGLTLFLGGIGAAVGLSLVSDPEASGTWPLGLIPVFVGLGLLLFYHLSSRFVNVELGSQGQCQNPPC